MSKQMLRNALQHASIPTLIASLAQITGEDRWLEPPFLPNRDVQLFADESGGLSEPVQQEVRNAIEGVLDELERGERTLPGAPEAERFARMMRNCVAENIPPEYVPLMMEEFHYVERDIRWSKDVPAERLAQFHVLIVGAGMSGICAAIKLNQLGIHWTMVEKNSDVGGTWLENDYPEAGVDTPNHFYSYSFAPNHNWSGYFSKRGEVLDYFRDVADRFQIRERTEFNAQVTCLAWDETTKMWSATVQGADGAARVIDVNAVITAVGQLNRPKIPAIQGLATFTGPCFHTAQWRHDVSMKGRRVAIVGTGASAMQILRTVAAQASHVTIFQRSPQWVRPSTDYHRKVSPEVKWLLGNVPYYYQWYRFGLFWRFADGLLKSLHRDPDWPHPDRSVNRRNDRHREQLADYLMSELADREDLIPKVLPDYPPYGKRILVDNDWFQSLKRENVTLVNAGVQRIDQDTVIDASGDAHAVDVIILATGFEVGKMLMPITIKGRSSVPLHDVWGEDDPRAYKGITIPDYPNLFCIYGPNTGLGHGGSAIFQTECQVRYITACLADMLEKKIATVEIKRDVHDTYNARVDAEHAKLVWTHPGMSTWHRNDKGRVFATMPWRLVDYWQMTHSPVLSEYVVTQAET